MSEPMFPILDDPVIKAIPWRFIAPHEPQAKANHGGQTLTRLALRGGLSAAEAYMVVQDRRYPIGQRFHPASVRFHLIRMLFEFELAREGAM